MFVFDKRYIFVEYFYQVQKKDKGNNRINFITS